MYQYLKIERIATPCCLIPNTSYLKKKYFKGKRKKKKVNKRSDWAKLSRWFGFPTYSQCIAVRWSWTGKAARTTPGQRSGSGVAGRLCWSYARGSWNCWRALKPSKWFWGALLFLLLGLLGRIFLTRAGVTDSVPVAIPCPSTACSNARVLGDRKETEPGN